MIHEPSPAFLLYVKDWRSSRKVQNMNFEERGMYLEMLLEQWEVGSVPASPADLAALLGGTTADWRRAWKKLSGCFVARKRDGRLMNLKLERVRRDRLKYKKAQAESGLRGAEARWKRHGKPIGSPSEPIASPMARNGSSSSFASSTPSPSACVPSVKVVPTVPHARRRLSPISASAVTGYQDARSTEAPVPERTEPHE